MRIRKRLPLSSLPSVPLPDLCNLHRSDAPAPPLSGQPPDPLNQKPSDQNTTIGDHNHRWLSLSPKTDITQETKMKQKEFGDDETWRYDETSNDIRKILSISDCKETDDHKILLPPSLSTAEGSWWCEGDGDKTVPLKKRKGSFERNPNEQTMKAKMKSKTNKKCGIKDIYTAKEEDDDGVSSCNSMGGGKKCKRGDVIMEGSRCSRVNGRGWRCSQPTLVGYSLCEHHLGKGRLRSMATVRRGGGAPPPSGGGSGLSVVTKKRTKVGVVKARSISSLLNQS